MPLEILRELKDARHLTMKKIADLTGESTATIRRIFNNGSEPRWITMCKLADMFDVPLDFFRDQRDPRIVRKSEVRHLWKYRAIDPRRRAVVDRLLDEQYAAWKQDAETDDVVTIQHRLDELQATSSYVKLKKVLEYADSLEE